jgi:hypothetical protein
MSRKLLSILGNEDKLERLFLDVGIYKNIYAIPAMRSESDYQREFLEEVKEYFEAIHEIKEEIRTNNITRYFKYKKKEKQSKQSISWVERNKVLITIIGIIGSFFSIISVFLFFL